MFENGSRCREKKQMSVCHTVIGFYYYLINFRGLIHAYSVKAAWEQQYWWILLNDIFKKKLWRLLKITSKI